MKAKRKSVRIHTRKIDRGVARHELKASGVHRPNKRLSELWRKF